MMPFMNTSTSCPWSKSLANMTKFGFFILISAIVIITVIYFTAENLDASDKSTLLIVLGVIVALRRIFLLSPSTHSRYTLRYFCTCICIGTTVRNGPIRCSAIHGRSTTSCFYISVSAAMSVCTAVHKSAILPPS